MSKKQTKTRKKCVFDNWITEDIEYKKTTARIMESIEPRVVEICKKFAKGNVNSASLPAFWYGIQGDIDEVLKQKIEEKKNEKS